MQWVNAIAHAMVAAILILIMVYPTGALAATTLGFGDMSAWGWLYAHYPTVVVIFLISLSSCRFCHYIDSFFAFYLFVISSSDMAVVLAMQRYRPFGFDLYLPKPSIKL